MSSVWRGHSLCLSASGSCSGHARHWHRWVTHQPLCRQMQPEVGDWETDEAPGGFAGRRPIRGASPSPGLWWVGTEGAGQVASEGQTPGRALSWVGRGAGPGSPVSEEPARGLETAPLPRRLLGLGTCVFWSVLGLPGGFQTVHLAGQVEVGVVRGRGGPRLALLSP